MHYHYSIGEQFLHYLALNFKPVIELSLDIEKQLFGEKASGKYEGSTYVMGLARSGTTALMTMLCSPTSHHG